VGLWLRRLSVTNFAGIESAEFELGPGFNVCHGPNELGKSTLVKAIRAALLLQDSSSSAADFVDWQTDAQPEVALTFETEPERIWRVRKRFDRGRGGASYLDFSRDGAQFVQDARGREVEGRLQDLLQWGIDAPGGKGRRRGIPESFISTALLGNQDEVTAILNRSLEEDPSNSGKLRLTEALQAMAQDPVFGRIIGLVQAKVDEAFTGTGRKKSGQNSPWVHLRDRVKLAEERLREIQRKVDDSESARGHVTELHQQSIAVREVLSNAERSLHNLNAALGQQQVRDQVARQLDEAATNHERVSVLERRMHEIEASLAARRGTSADLEARRDELAAHRTEGQARFEQAREAVRELESGAGEQQRRLREQEIEKAILTNQATRSSLAARMEHAGRISARHQRGETIRSDIEGVTSSLREAEDVLAQARVRYADDERKLALLSHQLLARRLLVVRATLVETEASRSTLAKDREQAQVQLKDAASMRSEVETWHAPAPALLVALRELEIERRVSRERLEVGLTLTITPHNEASLDVAVDGADSEALQVPAAGAEISARRELALVIPGFGDLVIRGGAQGMQAELDELNQRWAEEAEPVLKAAGCDDPGSLEVLVQRALDRRREADSIDAEARSTMARTQDSTAIESARGDQVDAIAVAERDLAASLPDDTDLEGFVADLDEARTGPVIQVAIDKLRPEMDRRRDLGAALAGNAQGDEGRLEGLEVELEALDGELASELESFDGDWEAVLTDGATELARLDESLARDNESRLAVQQEATREVDEVRQALEDATRTVEAVDVSLRETNGEIDFAREAIAELDGEMRARVDAFSKEDPAAAAARVVDCQAELDALPEPEQDVEPEEVRAAEQQVAAAADAVEGVKHAVDKAEGAIEQVGGDYIEEQQTQAKEALQVVTGHQRDLEVEYEAWQLLRDTLKAAENEDAVHLGSALVDPVSDRMAALTGGRYGKVDIAPALQTAGIDLGGASREAASLSLGTQEQLATLLRISIAEALTSFLVMDDQLTQSDAARMERLRVMLRAASAGVQVVVFTCHPDAYLVDAGPEVATVDLRRVVKRGEVMASAAKAAGEERDVDNESNAGPSDEALKAERDGADAIEEEEGRPEEEEDQGKKDQGKKDKKPAKATTAHRKRAAKQSDLEDLKDMLRDSPNDGEDDGEDDGDKDGDKDEDN